MNLRFGLNQEVPSLSGILRLSDRDRLRMLPPMEISVSLHTITLLLAGLELGKF